MTQHLEQDLRAVLTERAARVAVDADRGEMQIAQRLSSGDQGLIRILDTTPTAAPWLRAAAAIVLVMAGALLAIVVTTRDSTTVRTDRAHPPTGDVAGPTTEAPASTLMPGSIFGPDAPGQAAEQFMSDVVGDPSTTTSVETREPRDGKPPTGSVAMTSGSGAEVIAEVSVDASLTRWSVTGVASPGLAYFEHDAGYLRLPVAGVLTVATYSTGADRSPDMASRQLLVDEVRVKAAGTYGPIESPSSGWLGAELTTADGTTLHYLYPVGGRPFFSSIGVPATTAAGHATTDIFHREWIADSATGDESTQTLSIHDVVGSTAEIDMAYIAELERWTVTSVRSPGLAVHIQQRDKAWEVTLEAPTAGLLDIAIFDGHLEEATVTSQQVQAGDSIAATAPDAGWLRVILTTPEDRTLVLLQQLAASEDSG